MTVTFPFDFKADAATEVVVVDQNGIELSDALYSVSVDAEEGGSATFSDAPLLADYAELYIVSDPAMTQQADFGNSGPSFNPAALTRALDRAAIRDLRLLLMSNASVRMPLGETLEPIGRTSFDDRAGKFIGFGFGGDLVLADGTPGPTGATSIDNLGIVAPTITGTASTDTTVINAALADAAVSGVMLPPGTIEVVSAILVPTGKTLIGSGRDKTTIKAHATYAVVGGWNAIVVAPTTTGVSLRDFTIDVNNALPATRINGAFMYYSRDFNIQRVDVLNASGYAHVAVGDANSFTVYSGGYYEDCYAENSQIHFEAMACDGVTYVNCRSAEGAGTIACQSFFHPLTGSRNITYFNCSGEGDAGAGAEITANVATMFNINFIDCDLRVTGLGIGIVSNGVFATTKLGMFFSKFTSDGYQATNLEYSTGKVVGCTFTGIDVGFRSFNYAAQWDVSNSDVIVTSPAATAYGVLAEGGAAVRWSGGHISAIGGAGSQPIPLTGVVVASPETKLSPMGGGFTLRKMLPSTGASSASLTGAIIGIGYSDPWTFPVVAGRRYKVEVDGYWIHATGTSNGRFGVLGAGGAAGTIRGVLFLGTSATQRTINMISAITGVSNAAAQVEALGNAATYFELGGWLVFECTVAGTISLQIGTSDAADAMSLGGLSTMTVEEI